MLLHGARHVALQFPEAFLADAADVVWQLEGIFEAAGKAPYDDGAGPPIAAPPQKKAKPAAAPAPAAAGG